MRYFQNKEYKEDKCNTVEFIVSDDNSGLELFEGRYSNFEEISEEDFDKSGYTEKCYRISVFSFYGSL